MKRNFLLPVLMILTGLLSQVIAQTKHALIVAIGNYPAENGWHTINSIRDVTYVRAALESQGFSKIKILKDREADFKSICQAFDQLLRDCKEGDIVAIHFSTHGEQVEDLNNDEVDKLDESIVTYKAISPLLATKEDFAKVVAEYFTDDIFGMYIDSLRKKLKSNGDIVVFIDACHSGSGTRGLAQVRGGQIPLLSNQRGIAIKDSAGVFKEKATSKAKMNDLASYVLISAARAEELNHETVFEGEGIGSLSYALSEVFAGKLETGTTYRSIFARIQSIMNKNVPDQHPVLEGDGIDRQLFGGRFIAQKPFIEIASIKGNKMELKAGKLMGLDKDAKIEVHQVGTKDPSSATPIASGIISASTSYRATATLEKAINITPSLGWVFVTEPVFRTDQVSIQITNVSNSRGAVATFTSAEVEQITGTLKNIPIVSLDDKPELLIKKGIKRDSILIASNGYLFRTLGNIPQNGDSLKMIIAQYTKFKTLRDIEIRDGDALVEIKLVPVINGKIELSNAEDRIVNGTYEFRNGDKIVLYVTNPGEFPIYFNILDIQPDGIIRAVLPNSRALDAARRHRPITAEELKLAPGESKLLENFKIGISPPYGTEIFKVFVSRELINVEELAGSNGETARGKFSVFSKLFRDRSTTRGDTDNISNKDGSVYDLIFRIVQ